MKPAVTLSRLIVAVLSLWGLGVSAGLFSRLPKSHSGTSMDLVHKREHYRLKTKEAFYHGLGSYLKHAYPKDELKSLSCSGEDTLGNFTLTLIDSLDTAAVIGDMDLFLDLIHLSQNVTFDQNVTVSVFETNIRIIGGLLSAHVIAATHPDTWDKYNHGLLGLVVDLADRLLPAFKTPTGLPYGSINLKYGIHPEESTLVCTACAGTFSLEFTWISILTGLPVYEEVARKATKALYDRRSTLGLYGNHIDVITGAWAYKECSIGGGVDSYYEYLLKTWIAFADENEYHEMFVEAYRAVKMHMKRGLWNIDVMMDNGVPIHERFHSLGAFWPGLKALAGDLSEAMDELDAISQILAYSPFLAEMTNIQTFEPAGDRHQYPLRPELIESIWMLHRATGDSELLELGFEMFDRIEKFTRVECGFANIENVNEAAQGDKMESFFLAETLKYFYLLFDHESPFNSENFVFNTEAHPFLTLPTSYRPRSLFQAWADPFTYSAWESKGYDPTKPTAYRGIQHDHVVVGFAHGVCLKSDWTEAREKKVKAWRSRNPSRS
ncbi:ER degradation enhancer, mannosidase alpha-like 2 [Polychytrium aggregatum]|uniref:ER degradation enhancer, mannosidase alpha-like 2 n=1 Tax=Polychytrium aggregatum TaxID=110093 RepID=UPI0022FE6067|nr:ER degradation enhancer, mannosidase alpha-like 2 [Polychytrium aggregatum]KAI9208021.1 ER degradation enhancer, mannosidase alpha-like 2 [Polychytrium aggregatum]